MTRPAVGRQIVPIDTPSAHVVNGRPLAGPYPPGSEIVDLGMGCFWGAERRFWDIPGVWVTAAGYQGAAAADPAGSHEAGAGHAGDVEVVRVVFDPSVVAYERLLQVFWESHDPTQGFRQGDDIGPEYRSAIFAHGEAQLAAALASRDAYAAELERAGFGPITTEIREAPEFHLAESRHQQYFARRRDGSGCRPDHSTNIGCPVGLATTD